MKKILNGAVVGALICSAVLLLAACEPTAGTASTNTGSGGTTTNGGSTTNGGTDGTGGTTPTATCKVDFESANITTLTADGFTAEMGDMNATWGDDTAASFGKATSDMSFSADTSLYTSGFASLKVSATVYQNHYSHNVGQWVLNIDLAKAGISAPVDLTGKTVTIKARVPAAGGLTSVKLVFKDSNGQPSQAKEVPVTTKDTWTDITYKYVDGGAATSDYTAAGFDITKIASISVVAIKNGASATSSETLYVDGLDW
jgi:hypothetical protein